MRYLYILSFLLMAQMASAQSAGFEYEKFKEMAGLSLSSDARMEKGRIRLTPAEENRRGGLWFSKKRVFVADTFEMGFCFRIHKNGGRGPSGKGGEGIALVIHNNEYANKNGKKGEGMGYEGIPNSIAIEFDVQDQEGMGQQHVSVQTNGIAGNSYKKTYSLGHSRKLGINMKDGDVHHAQITYNNPELIIQLDGKEVLRLEMDINEHINLDGGTAWVGLVAATGRSKAIHELSCWTMDCKEKTIPYPVSDRELKRMKRVIVNSKVVKIRVWDINQEDGDIVSVNLNGKWIINHFTLSIAGDVFEVELDGQQNYLILHAHNLGSIPPNTAGVAILDENGNQEVTMRSNMQVSEALLIEYHKTKEDE